MAERRNVLTPEALAMMDSIARTGSFAAAARELGKVPSALTYNVRQLEDALDVLLFDRRSRNAHLTAAGEELLREGRRLLLQMDAVANRVRRVACGWETELTLAVDNIIAPRALFDLVGDFYDLRVEGETQQPNPGPPTRLKLRNEVLSGTWEALARGQADLAIGIADDRRGADIDCAALGTIEFVFAVAPHHPLAAVPEPLSSARLAEHRIVAVADTARELQPVTVGVLPGQDVLTVPSLAAKIEAQIRGLGCGYLPEPLARRHLQAGRLVARAVDIPRRAVDLHYAWRRQSAHVGKALAWWLERLQGPATREALLTQHEGLVL